MVNWRCPVLTPTSTHISVTPSPHSLFCDRGSNRGAMELGGITRWPIFKPVGVCYSYDNIAHRYHTYQVKRVYCSVLQSQILTSSYVPKTGFVHESDVELGEDESDVELGEVCRWNVTTHRGQRYPNITWHFPNPHVLLCVSSISLRVFFLYSSISI